jgi:hypothetical protein
MANRRLVRSIDDLSISEYGRLPNGILCNKWHGSDRYTAKKETLIAAGIARAEWFPPVPVPIPNRPGKFQRSFIVETERGDVDLTENQATEKWTVGLPVCDEEQQRRDAEWRAQIELRQAEHESREEAERLAALKVALRSLPPFVPGSMSEAERHHMRILRGLDDEHREHLIDLAERMLTVPSNQPRLGPERRGLQLVIDNGAQPIG